MKTITITSGYILLGIGILTAAQPVASVTSSSSFDLRGHAVAVNGVPAWPLGSGDDIRTHSSPAAITLRDGSRVTLLADSQARVESTATGLTLRLLSGSMRVGTVAPSVHVYTGSTAVRPVSGQVIAIDASAIRAGAGVAAAAKPRPGPPPPFGPPPPPPAVSHP